MTSIRLSVGGDDHQEKEKDANAQLMELDKGLMSQKHGEQCEAIVRFPKLFEKYPFPILINSAFLKLGDVFRVGSNFLRLCVLKVAQQSEKHLDKILNIEEFMRRIFAVIYSNDPVARAITLRTLGSCASVICERKNVHHSIINGLDSHDAVELDAAIYAATRFAEKSEDFASSICNKLAEMIQGLATPAEMKLKLIPIFQHMHHDASTATKVRQLCTEMLKQYPAEGSVCITLHTLSLLSAKSLLDLHEQVCLLLEYLHSDPRQNVKKLVLCDLNLLAKKGSHIWEEEHIQSLGLFGLNTPFQSLKIGALTVLIVLAKSIAVTKFSLLPGSEVVQLCNQVCFDSNVTLAAKATSLIVYLAIHQDKAADGPSKLSEDAVTALETMLIVSSTDSSAKYVAALKVCLRSTVEICTQCPAVTDRFVLIMISNLPNVTGDCAASLCECLASVSSQTNNILQNHVPELIQTLKEITTTCDPSWESLTVWLLTLLFQALVDEDIADDTEDFINALLSKLNAWNVYKVARQAARYRHHKVAAHIFSAIVTEVSSEHLYFWLSALHQCSLAEICLTDTPESLSSFTGQLNRAQTHYQKAISSLRAGNTPNFKHEFSCEFIRLRAEMLQAHLHLIKACCSFRTSPPPAIASSLAMTTHQEIHRFGHVVNHFQKCGRKFEQVYHSYGQLYQQSFDADPSTLINIRLLQQSCQMIMYILESLLTSFQGSKKDGERSMKLFETVEGSLIEHHAMLAAHQDAMNLLQQTLAEPTPAPLTHQHISCLEKVSMMVCSVPLCYPRYFFQSQQSTSIKLAITPLPSSMSEPVTVHFDTGLTLKVEGVITHGNRPGLYRKVHKVQIHARSKQESFGQMMPDQKVKENPTNEMVKTVEAHNDFFSCQLLFSFVVPGIHSVFVEAAVQGDDGMVWKTGPQSVMTVKCYDEAVHRQQQQQYAAAKTKLHAAR